MPTLHRFTVDVVTDEDLSESRLNTIANDLSDYVHLLGTETDDGVIKVEEKYVNGHVHDTTEDRCRRCYYHARDSKNGDTQVD